MKHFFTLLILIATTTAHGATCGMNEYLNGDTCTPIDVGYYGLGCTEMPVGYTRLEYIEGTGTQIITTEYIPNDNTETYAKYEWTEIEPGWKNVFGNYASDLAYNDAEATNVTRIVQKASTNEAYVNNNTRATNGATRIPLQQRNIVYEIYIGKNIYTENGKSYRLNTLKEKNNTRPIRIISKSKIRMYYIRFFENNILMADFIPAQRNSDLAIGMYDMVEGKFYTNSGTDEFIPGPPSDCASQSQCTPGFYCINGVHLNCTNAPNNSIYTTAGWTNSDCPWTCDKNYVQTAIDTCNTLCPRGATSLRTGTGINVPLFATRNTTPAINVEFNGAVCYADLVSGTANDAINIEYNGQTYHTVAQ